MALQRGYLHRDLLDLHNKYGSIVRIAPNELAYIDPQAWKDIHGTRPGQALIERNSVWFRRRPDEPDSIMGSNEEAHARYRRAFAGSFTEKAVKDQSPVLEKYVSLLMQKFDKLCEVSSGSTTVNITSWFNFVTFDISGNLSFGESFGSTERGEAHPWVEIACSFGKGIALLASLNFYHPLQRLLAYAMPKKVREKVVYHRQLSTQMSRQRLQHKSDRADFMRSVLKYNNEKGEQVSSFELEHNMSVFVFAGSETTSTAMTSVIYHLLRVPDALAKVTAEIRLSFRKENEIDTRSVSKLDYLAAVIDEGMRLGPAVPVGVPRVVPKSGAYICDKWVPGGTLVTINQYTTNRSRMNFSDPDVFKPERFLTASKGDNLTAFQPFLLGRHMCIGHRFACAEMRLILARLLWSFDLAWADELKLESWGEQQTFIFWQKSPLYVRLSRRRQ